MQTIRLVLTGLGNLGRRFCEILLEKDKHLRQRYGLSFRIVGAADSRGVAYDPAGLDLAQIVRLKKEGASISTHAGANIPLEYESWDAIALVSEAEAEVLLEATPVNLKQGAEPGLTCVRTAMERGMHVVTPNKGPLVVAYQELQDLAKRQDVRFLFDGTVAGGLPAINIGRRDMRGATIYRLEAVPNLVTGYVIDLMVEGLSWDEAVARAGEEGVLEADPTWDLEGWDAAAKLVILANVVLETPAKLEDVIRSGITNIQAEELNAAKAGHRRYRLLARAELRDDGNYNLSVAPVPLSSDHPLGRLGAKQMGVAFHTDIYGTLVSIIDEPNPIPSSATMLRDLLDIYVP
jgi:homoserine dehydrogenase